MPTHQEFNELRNNCTWEPVLVGGSDILNTPYIAGYIGTSKINGNTIFFPSNGFKNGSELANADITCRLWTSTVEIRKPYYYANGYAYNLTSVGNKPLDDADSHVFPSSYYKFL